MKTILSVQVENSALRTLAYRNLERFQRLISSMITIYMAAIEDFIHPGIAEFLSHQDWIPYSIDPWDEGAALLLLRVFYNKEARYVVVELLHDRDERRITLAVFEFLVLEFFQLFLLVLTCNY